MGELTRNFDWSRTSIESPDKWPHSLQITVSNILRSRFPMFLWWGKDMIQFYNDAYRPSMGNEGKHPSALGAKGADTWPEIWEIISPLMKQVESTGEATWMENQLVPIFRNGKIEDVYWTFSYSSVIDDEGNHGGILVTCMETTGTVIANQRIAKSQHELLQLFEESPVAIATIIGNEDLVFEYVNHFYGLLVGRPANEIVGKPLLEALPELKGQGFDNILKEVIRSGKPYTATEVVFEILRAGKMETIYVDLTYQPRSEKDGSVSGVLVVATDLTQQVRARKNIEESEAKLRSILNSTPTAIGVFVGPDLIVENPNQLLIEVMAAGPDIEGKSFRQLLSGLVEEDQTFLQIIDNVRTSGEHFEAREVKVFFRKEEKTRYFNISFIPLRDESGNIYAVLDVSVDVTEQVLSQKKIEESKENLSTALEQLRLSKEAAELGTFDMDLKSNTMHWDERCRILFGISHQEAVSFDKDFIPSLHPDDRQRILEVIDKAFIKEKGNGDYDVEYRTIGAEDKVERWVKAKGKVYFNENETPVRFIGSVLDITPQKTEMHQIEMLVEERTKELAQANETLKTINKELKRSNDNLEEFAHAASHDLKEPVRKIQFFTDQLKQQMNNHVKEDELRLFTRIENASKRMGNLIDDLLLYSHVSQRPHETETVDLNEKVQRVLEDLDLDIEEKKATITVANLPVVKGFRRQLQQLFQNLISNAVKYSRNNVPPVINITADRSEQQGRQYHILEVADNGIGFEIEYAEKIFQMFARLHGRNEYSGTGVGLSIVKKVVENHDGFIEVESEVNRGSVFKVYLPVW